MDFQKIVLGDTGIEVTELCFGALPIGPAQKNIPVEEAAATIALALEEGIRFVDTAQGYQTYPHIRRAMERTGIRPVITSKSPAATYEDMQAAVDECLEQLGIDCVDIFLLHAARVGTDVFHARAGALQCLLDCKARGQIRAVGISTHAADVTRAAADRDDLDVVFPIHNKLGMGVLGGTLADMESAVERCHSAGKGVYLMKALAGGNLVGDYRKALSYSRDFSRGGGVRERFPIAVGMVNREEVEMNARYFRGQDISGYAERTAPAKEFFVLGGICKSCGTCVQACHSSAISLKDGVPVIDRAQCLTCGYCVAACPEFAIRMI